MSEQAILFSEKCGTLGRLTLYKKDEVHNKVIRLNDSETLVKSVSHRIQDFLREIFLPHGYPDSVSADYLEYQIWDTVQAFCSTITGTFTTQAVLKSVGVGNANVTPVAAAITWIMKDGTGMIGRIVFAWWKGNGLDADCKKWRLCADILNDAAMFLELLVPYISIYSLQVLCMTTAMKAVVGVAGSATRASITQHQAIQGNMGEVSAKDGSQETFVNLIASFVGIVLLTVVSDEYCAWLLFAVFTIIHLIANYLAVCSLNITLLNAARLILVLRTYLRFDTVPNPVQVNKRESVVIGFGPSIKEVCGFDIKIGSSLKTITSCGNLHNITSLIDMYKDFKYLLLMDIKKKVIYVALEKGEQPRDVISAYFHAVLLGIVTSNHNQVSLNVYAKRQLRHVTSMVRLQSTLKEHPKNFTNIEMELPLETLKAFNQLAIQEITMFFTALRINGWKTDTHAIEVGEWRAQWKRNEEILMEQSHLVISEKANKMD